MTQLLAGRSGVRIPAGATDFSLTYDHLWSPTSLLFSRSQEVICLGWGQWDWLQNDVENSLCPALRLRMCGTINLSPTPCLHGMDRDNFTITARFVVNWVRSLIHKDSGVLLKFYDFVHPCSKPLADKLTQWNLDFIFLRGPFKMNVKSTEWKFTCVIHLNEYCTALNMQSSSTQWLKNAI